MWNSTRTFLESYSESQMIENWSSEDHRMAQVGRHPKDHVAMITPAIGMDTFH